MYRSNSARVVPIVILAVVTIALILGLVTVGRYIFGGSASTTADDTEQTRDQLLTVNIDRSMVMTIRGPIVGDENFLTEEVNISSSSRTYTLFNGYKDRVQDQTTLSNNTAAYEQFVYALDKADITAPGRYTASEASDLRGICATGRVYEFGLYDGSARLQWYWTSTCKGSPGTLGASVDQVVNLFTKQIPGVKMEFASTSNQLTW